MERVILDAVYCWECRNFSFVRRQELKMRAVRCQRCESNHIGDVGELQYNVQDLAEHCQLNELIERAKDLKIMIEINKTPQGQRKVGPVVLQKITRPDIESIKDTLCDEIEENGCLICVDCKHKKELIDWIEFLEHRNDRNIKK